MTLEDGFTTPWENGDILRLGHWILIFNEARMSRNVLGNHAIVYHALMDAQDIHNRNFGQNYPPYISIGPSTGVGYFEGNYELRRASNEDIDIFMEMLSKWKGAVWNSKAKRLEHFNGILYQMQDISPQGYIIG